MSDWQVLKNVFPLPGHNNETLLTAFTTASQTGDVSDFIKLLKDDIVLFSDGGGKSTTAIHPLVHIGQVASFLQGMARRGFLNWALQPVYVNGDLGFLLFDKESNQLNTIMVLELSND